VFRESWFMIGRSEELPAPGDYKVWEEFGETVVVEGTNFSPRAGETTVRFGREEAVVRNATPTRLEVVVPEQAASGPISVAVRYAAAVSGATELARFSDVFTSTMTSVRPSGS